MYGASISEILDVESQLEFYNDITKFQFHTHTVYSGQEIKPSDEARIHVASMDQYSLPCKSFIFIEGEVKCTKPAAKAGDAPIEAKYILSSNLIGNLFDEIRYELAGQQISKSRLIGLTSTIKAILVKNMFDKNTYHLAGFDRAGYTLKDNKFTFCVPLKLVLPFFEDFQRIILNLKQELVLLRSPTDLNCIESTEATNVNIKITKLQWRIPYITLEDHVRLKFLRLLDADTPLKLSFRHWEISELPNLQNSTVHSWAVKTASHLDTPKYVVLAFQTDRKNKINKSISEFDSCNLQNAKVYLNSDYFPYENLLGKQELMYRMFLDFPSAYYNHSINTELGTEIDFDTFCTKTPLIVIDCSHQSSHLKSSTDIRIDMEFKEAVPPNTSAYCILISDRIMEYTPLTSMVKEVQ